MVDPFISLRTSQSTNHRPGRRPGSVGGFEALCSSNSLSNLIRKPWRKADPSGQRDNRVSRKSLSTHYGRRVGSGKRLYHEDRICRPLSKDFPEIHLESLDGAMADSTFNTSLMC